MPRFCTGAAYQIQSVGTCGGGVDFIESEAECNAAAAVLGLPDTTADTRPDRHGFDVGVLAPLGCYIKSGTPKIKNDVYLDDDDTYYESQNLWFNSGPGNDPFEWGRHMSHRLSICRCRNKCHHEGMAIPTDLEFSSP